MGKVTITIILHLSQKNPMAYFINLNIYEFSNKPPGWFEWLSLAITVFGIITAYLIATYNFKQEIKKENEKDKKSQENEISFLKENLRKLQNPIIIQINNIDSYTNSINDTFNSTFNLSINPVIDTTFLNAIDIKNLYIHTNFEEQKVHSLNKLFTSLYAIDSFKKHLINGHKEFINSFSYFEDKFAQYKELINFKYYKLCWSETVSDEYKIKYTKLLKEYTQNSQFLNSDNTINRGFFANQFLERLINLSNSYISKDIYAIDILSTAQSVKDAYLNLNALRNAQVEKIVALKVILQEVQKEISSYLNEV